MDKPSVPRIIFPCFSGYHRRYDLSSAIPGNQPSLPVNHSISAQTQYVLHHLRLIKAGNCLVNAYNVLATSPLSYLFPPSPLTDMRPSESSSLSIKIPSHNKINILCTPYQFPTLTPVCKRSEPL